MGLSLRTRAHRPPPHRLEGHRLEGQRRARPPGAGPDRAGLDAARGVLDTARGVLERGWCQYGWYEWSAPPRPLRARRHAQRPPAPEQVSAACLVAAVALAAHAGGPRLDVLTDAGPALDLLWDALWEARGYPEAPVSGRAAAPAVRAARAHELVCWNDEPGRTRAEVLALLDLAISRGIMGAVGAGAPPQPVPARA